MTRLAQRQECRKHCGSTESGSVALFVQGLQVQQLIIYMYRTYSSLVIYERALIKLLTTTNALSSSTSCTDVSVKNLCYAVFVKNPAIAFRVQVALTVSLVIARNGRLVASITLFQNSAVTFNQ